MKSRIWMGLGLGLSLLLGLLGCGGGGEAASSGSTSGGEVPAQYLGAVESEDTARGESMYAAACAPCHDNGAPPVADIGWDVGHMRQQIREGSGNMPPITADRLGDEDMEAVLAYLATVGAIQ